MMMMRMMMLMRMMMMTRRSEEPYLHNLHLSKGVVEMMVSEINEVK
jgi:hypothetical protein